MGAPSLNFFGDFQVTSYGGELRYTITYEASLGAQALDTQPHVVLQGNGIFLEHYANIQTPPGFPVTITVPVREVRSSQCLVLVDQSPNITQGTSDE